MPIGQLKQTLTNLDPIIPSCIIYILRRGRITDAMDHFAVSDRNYIFNTTLPTILFISHCDYPSHYGWWEENKIFAAKFGIIPTIPVILGSLRNPDQCRQIEQGSVAAVRAETKRKLIDAIRTNSGTEWIPPMQNHLRNKWKFWERYSCTQIGLGLCILCFLFLFVFIVYIYFSTPDSNRETTEIHIISENDTFTIVAYLNDSKI